MCPLTPQIPPGLRGDPLNELQTHFPPPFTPGTYRCGQEPGAHQLDMRPCFESSSHTFVGSTLVGLISGSVLKGLAANVPSVLAV